jgi:hypothetical protein
VGGKSAWIGAKAVSAVAVLTALSIAACTGGTSGSTATPTPLSFAQQPVDRAGVPTAEIVEQTGGQPTTSGIQIDDGCVVGRIPSPQGTGQVFGNGVNIVAEVDSLLTFSRAVSETALVACRGNPGRTEVEQLVARLNGVPGMRVVDYSWPGR